MKIGKKGKSVKSKKVIKKKKKKKKKFDFRSRDASEEVGEFYQLLCIRYASSYHMTFPLSTTDGNGVEILYDDRKRLFILCDRSEDRLLMSLKINERATYVIDRSTVLLLHSEYSVNNKLKQKLWRRFIREFIGKTLFMILGKRFFILFGTCQHLNYKTLREWLKSTRATGSS